MTPTHSEGRAAAQRVQAANQDGHLPDAKDAITMMTYHMSLVLRQLDEGCRLAEAQKLARLLIANTKESLG